MSAAVLPAPIAIAQENFGWLMAERFFWTRSVK
jgi:hypothetical protein